jgi:hypothetical protein
VKLTCRYTGLQLEGDFVHAGDATELPACPECGAEPDEECHAPDPKDTFKAIAISPYIHRSREEADAAEDATTPGTDTRAR